MNLDQTLLLGSSLIWVHFVCNIGHRSTQAAERADDIAMNGGKRAKAAYQGTILYEYKLSIENSDVIVHAKCTN